MLVSFSRRLLALLLAMGVLSFTPVSAYDTDYEDEEQEVKKSKKKKKKSKQKKDEDDYWDEDSWEDDEVEPVVKKKKKKSKKSKKKSKKKKQKAEEKEDSWDDWDSWDEDDSDAKNDGDDDEKDSWEDEEDFFAEDESEPVKAEEPAPVDTPEKVEPAPAAAEPEPVAKPEPKPVVKKETPRQACVRKLIAGSPDIDYVELNVVHPGWQNPVRVCREHRVLVHMNHWHEVATVLELTERELRVKWDNWGEERFLRQPDNRYVFETLVKRADSALSRKATRAAKRLRSRKAVPWEEYGWTGRMLDYIVGDEPPLTYKTFRLVNEDMDCKVRFSENEKVLVKMTKGNEPGAVLGYTGVKLHVRWESGTVESYRRMEDGSYRKIDDERVARQLLDPSISSREESEDGWFLTWWRDFTNEEKPLTYVTVVMRKGNIEYRPRLSEDNLVLMQEPPNQGWAKVIKFDRKQLIIRWNGETEELYERDFENIYHFVK